MNSRYRALSSYGPSQNVAYVTSRLCRYDSSRACPVKNVQPSHWSFAGLPSCHMWKYARSWRRPSNTSISGTAPCGPITGTTAFTSVIGSDRRAAASASPSRLCAFSRTSSLSNSSCQFARSTAWGNG
jgi:hypothetical protein